MNHIITQYKFYKFTKVHQINFQLFQLPTVGFKRIEKYRQFSRETKMLKALSNLT